MFIKYNIPNILSKKIATFCSFLLVNLLFSNVIRFLDSAIFLFEDFNSCWLEWQRDLAVKQSANFTTLQCERGPARYHGTSQDPHLSVLEYWY